MRRISKEERKAIEREITAIMTKSIGSDYVRPILGHRNEDTGDTLMDDIVQNVLDTSAWEDEGYYNDDDIRLAIGRELMARLGVDE